MTPSTRTEWSPNPVETFTPPTAFAYSVSLPGGFGTDTIENEIAKIDEAGPRR